MTHETPTKHEHEPLKYDLIDLDLGIPRQDVELPMPFGAAKIVVWHLDDGAEVTIRLGRPDAPALSLHQGDQLTLDANSPHRFWRLFLSNPEQLGKKLSLLLVSPPLDAARG